MKRLLRGLVHKDKAKKATQAGHPEPAEVISQIIEAHRFLSSMDSLEPSPIINTVLVNLVAVCSRAYDTKTVQLITQDARLKAIVPSLRSLCSKAEFQLESHWSAYITGTTATTANTPAANPDDDDGSGANPSAASDRLREFPYYQNYVDLVRLELSAIYTFQPTAPPTKIAYIGSGPLPLSSLCLYDALTTGPSPWASGSDSEAATAPFPLTLAPTVYDPAGVGPSDQSRHHNNLNNNENNKVTILNIDHSERAIALSRALVASLGDADGSNTYSGMTFDHGDASDSSTDLTSFDVVYVAALVGATQTEKEGILVDVAKRMRPGAVVVVRSAWGVRKCLYAEVDLATPALKPWLEPCLVVHPYHGVLNSVALAKVKTPTLP